MAGKYKVFRLIETQVSTITVQQQLATNTKMLDDSIHHLYIRYLELKQIEQLIANNPPANNPPANNPPANNPPDNVAEGAFLSGLAQEFSKRSAHTITKYAQQDVGGIGGFIRNAYVSGKRAQYKAAQPVVQQSTAEDHVRSFDHYGHDELLEARTEHQQEMTQILYEIKNIVHTIDELSPGNSADIVSKSVQRVVDPAHHQIILSIVDDRLKHV